MLNYAATEVIVRDRRRAREAQADRHAEITVADALHAATLFAACSKRELRLVARVAKIHTYPAGATLVVEGEPGDTMYVLISGTARVQRGARRVATLKAGSVVGELATLTKGGLRNATVTMQTEGDVAAIGRRELRKLVEGAPGFTFKLLEALANRVRELDGKLVN